MRSEPSRTFQKEKRSQSFTLIVGARKWKKLSPSRRLDVTPGKEGLSSRNIGALIASAVFVPEPFQNRRISSRSC